MRKGTRPFAQGLATLVILVSLIGVSASTVAAAGITGLTLTPETTTLAPGETVTVTVNVSGTSGPAFGIVELSVDGKSPELEHSQFTCDCAYLVDGTASLNVDNNELYARQATFDVTVADGVTAGQQLFLTIAAEDTELHVLVEKSMTIIVSTGSGTDTDTDTTTDTTTDTDTDTTIDTDTDTDTDTTTDTDTGTTSDTTDTDGDGVPDATDTCPTVANATQADVDENGNGDACEPALTINITSGNATLASTLAVGSSWSLSMGDGYLATGTFGTDDLALPTTIEVENVASFGTYTLAVDAGADFAAYSAEITIDEASETVGVVLEPTVDLVDQLVAILIQILDDILNG